MLGKPATIANVGRPLWREQSQTAPDSVIDVGRGKKMRYKYEAPGFVTGDYSLGPVVDFSDFESEFRGFAQQRVNSVAIAQAVANVLAGLFPQDEIRQGAELIGASAERVEAAARRLGVRPGRGIFAS